MHAAPLRQDIPTDDFAPFRHFTNELQCGEHLFLGTNPVQLRVEPDFEAPQLLVHLHYPTWKSDSLSTLHSVQAYITTAYNPTSTHSVPCSSQFAPARHSVKFQHLTKPTYTPGQTVPPTIRHPLDTTLSYRSVVGLRPVQVCTPRGPGVTPNENPDKPAATPETDRTDMLLWRPCAR